jgi:hypothetical protein
LEHCSQQSWSFFHSETPSNREEEKFYSHLRTRQESGARSQNGTRVRVAPSSGFQESEFICGEEEKRLCSLRLWRLGSGAEASGFIRGVILNTQFSIADSFFTVTWQAPGSVGYVRQVQAQKVVLVSSESRK